MMMLKKFRESLQVTLAFRELKEDKEQTATILTALAITVFIVGIIFRLQATLNHSLDRSLVEAQLATHVLETTDFSVLEIVEELELITGVGAAEAYVDRRITRMKLGDELWRPLVLFGRADFDEIAFSTLQFDPALIGPLEDGMILLERSAKDLTKAAAGDEIKVDAIEYQTAATIAGFAYSPSDLPGRFSRRVYGYATPTTIENLTRKSGYNRIFLQVSDNVDIKQIEKNIDAVMQTYGVWYDIKLVPQSSPLEQYLDPVFYLLPVLNFLALILALFLINTTMSGIISRKRGEIGRLKAIGFPTTAILKIYLGKALMLGLLAFCGAWVVQWLVFPFLSNLLQQELNVNIVNGRSNWLTLVVMLLVSLFVPLLAAFAPTWRTVQLPAQTALSHGTANPSNFNLSRFRAAKFLTTLPANWLYPLRNLLRQKRRSILMFLPLTVSGACFISILNVGDSLVFGTNQATDYWQEEIRLEFSQPLGAATVRNELLAIPGVDSVEGRFLKQGTQRLSNGELTTADKLAVVGLPPDTPFIRPTLVSGRWLTTGDTNHIVINTDYLRSEPDLAVGDDITLNFHGDVEIDFQIVGIVTGQILGSSGEIRESVGYVPDRYFAEQFDALGQATHFHLGTEKTGQEAVTAVAIELEDRLKQYKVSPDQLDIISELRIAIVNSFQTAVRITAGMAVLFGLVGTIGMISLVRLNIFERRLEFGILKSMGMDSFNIRRIIIGEVFLIGFFSWVVAVPIAWAVSNQLTQTLGSFFINAPLPQLHPPPNYLAWLGIIFVLSAATTWFATRQIKNAEAADLLMHQS
ncbi:MAG: ABC transporter permease [Chloroflexota bacterium]